MAESTPGRIIEPWSGTGWPITLFADKKALQDKRMYFCSRADCGKTRERILREPWQLSCGHRLCKDCVTFISNLPENQRICDACRDEQYDDEARSIRNEKKIAAMLNRKPKVEAMDTASSSTMVTTTIAETMDTDAVVAVSGNPEDHFKIETQDAMKDNAAHREVNRLAVTCPYECGANLDKLTIRLLEKHMIQCEKRLIPCEKCTETIQFSQRSEHMREICQFRPIECPNKCGKRGLQGKDLVKHMAECEKKPPVCSICKEYYTTRHDEHLVKCRAACPFNCGEEGKLPILKHLNDREKFAVHMLKLRDMFEEIRNGPPQTGNQVAASLSQPQIASFLDRLLQLECRAEQTQRTLTEKVSHMTKDSAASLLENSGLASKNRRDLIDLDALFKVLAGDVHLLTSYETTFRNLSDKIAKQESETSERLSKLETLSNIRVAEIEDQKTALSHFQMTSFQGHLIWKIERVQARRDEAHVKHSIYSHAFFTEVYGYKMCARIYFNGDGNGKNTHISLFFVVMKGEFDALLPWPFQQKVTMKLKNQTKKRPDIVEKFRPEPSSSSFQRPKNEMNIASGCPQFAEQGLTFSPENGYVVDNTMFIEIIVDNSYEALHGLNVSVAESGRGAAAHTSYKN